MYNFIAHISIVASRENTFPRDALYQSFVPLFAVITLLVVLCWFLFALGLFKIFEKTNVKRGKAFIPLYNVYVLCNLVGEKKSFIVLGGFMLAIPILAFIRMGVPGSYIFVALIIIMLVVYLVYFYILMLRLSNYFNKSILFTLGLFFFNCIFMLILGFGKYQSVSQ